ncbi:MAG: acylphosphatase [Candidatus Anstonellaceae archaeon]
MQRLKLLASGTVQGVGFRAFVIRIGESLSLVGYAKNLSDGNVEILAEGDRGKLDEFCRRISVKLPYGIHVAQLETLERTEIRKKSFASFGVAY